jgi:hypothetical protein
MTPNDSLPGLRLYMADGNGSPEEVQPPPSPRKYWTRRGPALRPRWDKILRFLNFRCSVLVVIGFWPEALSASTPTLPGSIVGLMQRLRL